MFLLLSDGDPWNSSVVRNDTTWWEGRDGGSACHLEFLRDLAEAAGQNQEKGSLKKAVANGSIE